MAQNISLLGATYNDVPAVELPKSGGGTASFTDVTDTTAAASDVASGKYFYTAAGVKTAGTASGGGGYFAEGTYTITEDTRYIPVSVSFQPKYVYAFVSNWRELTHSAWKRLMLAGKMSGEYQRNIMSSRLLNGSYGTTGGATDGAIASYSSGVLTLDATASGSQSYPFPAGATIQWFAAGNGGA